MKDISALVGIAIALGLIVLAIVYGGDIRAFVDVPSLAIVFFGTFAVTIASFSLKELFYTFAVVAKAIWQKAEDPSHAATTALEFADKARKEGILGLQRHIAQLPPDSFFLKGLTLLIDGATAEDAEKILHLDISAMAERHTKAISILRKAAEVAPAMGLIGTLIGLVQMLGNIADVSRIGPAMAIALLTTFYGALLAYVVLFPLASKLERNSRDEMLVSRLYLKAIYSIAKQENPRQLETLLNSLLSPAQRIQYFKQ